MLDPEAGRFKATDQASFGQMNKVPRKVKMQPVIAEGLRLKTVRVGNGDCNQTVLGQEARRLTDRVTGSRKMLQRVPEHDRCPLTIDLIQRLVAKIGASGTTLKAGRLPSLGAQGIEQGPVARTDVENRTRRCKPVEPAGELGPRTGKNAVADEAESTAC